MIEDLRRGRTGVSDRAFWPQIVPYNKRVISLPHRSANNAHDLSSPLQLLSQAS